MEIYLLREYTRTIKTDFISESQKVHYSPARSNKFLAYKKHNQLKQNENKQNLFRTKTKQLLIINDYYIKPNQSSNKKSITLAQKPRAKSADKVARCVYTHAHTHSTRAANKAKWRGRYRR